MTQQSAVFLDRDGVLNKALVRNGVPHPPRSVDEFEILAGVPEACVALRDAGYLLIVATNQPDIARGTLTCTDLAALHTRLRSELPLDDVMVCPHDDGECTCRKPAPGLLIEAARRFDIDLTGSVMVGDRWRDVDAGANAGCRTVFVDHGYAERRPTTPGVVVTSLLEAVPWILDLDSYRQAKEPC